ncbi:MAG TPA: glycosyltransferase [Pseudolysinimonas sp.]|nr:glycosyltransferase [Pseudolysinimonas sp.]
MTDATPSPKPLRILIGADTFAPDVNGSATFTRALAAGLVSRGHEVHVMVPAHGKSGTFTEEHSGQKMTVHRVYSWRWYPHPWLRFMLPWRVKANAERIVRAVKPDVIHFQSHIVVGRGLATAAEKYRIRLVGTNHTMPENMLQHVQVLPRFMLGWLVKIQWSSARKWFSKADELTAPTRRAADYFEKSTGLHNVHAISCGIDSSLYTPDFSPRERNIITFLGRLDEEKHVDELLAAVARLDPELDVEVQIVGDGESRRGLEAKARELGVADRTRFLGKVSYPELKAALTRTTVFGMPSRAELQSIATMEALASGLPVVAANAMALPHLVHHGVNGYLYEPGDVDAMAGYLTTVLTAPQSELDRMKKESLKAIAPHDIQRTLETFEAIYRGEQVTDPVTENIPTV